MHNWTAIPVNQVVPAVPSPKRWKSLGLIVSLAACLTVALGLLRYPDEAEELLITCLLCGPAGFMAVGAFLTVLLGIPLSFLLKAAFGVVADGASLIYVLAMAVVTNAREPRGTPPATSRG